MPSASVAMTHTLITGAAGQDGILLSQMLVADGHRVSGLVRPGTDVAVLLRYAPMVELLECDLGDAAALRTALVDLAPEEIYNLGGISSIVESIRNPEGTQKVNVGAVQTILTVLAEKATMKECRFVQAASGTIFEGSHSYPQDELSVRSPRTPYAMAKAATLDLIARARTESGLFASAAILYNHESPLRGHGFVTRRITEAAARIAAGRMDMLELGSIDVCRDWGWAPDYVRGMRLMMNADRPIDYVLATGQVNWLRDFLEIAFAEAGVANWQAHVRIRDDLRRSTDPMVLCGNSAKAVRELGWRRTKSFRQITEAMVAYDKILLDDPKALWQEP